MKVHAKRSDRNLQLSLVGELDHHGAKEIMKEIDRYLDVAVPVKTVLDLSQITFMDSSGIAVILRLYQRMQNLDGSMKVSGVPKQAYRVLQTAGIDQIIAIEEGEKSL